MFQQNISEVSQVRISLNQVDKENVLAVLIFSIIFIFSVVVSKSVTNVKPEVLASGRILTHMTPIPANLKYYPLKCS